MSIWLSNVRSATTRLSRPFSSLSRRSSLASSAFMPPYWLRHRLYVCSLISSSRATSATFLPSAASRSPSRSLRITCSTGCFRPFIEFLLPLLEALRNSHISWTSFQGSGQGDVGCVPVVSSPKSPPAPRGSRSEITHLVVVEPGVGVWREAGPLDVGLRDIGDTHAACS